jgi:ABC-type cobalamin/Fe3+-siderophores transport system ATPase subunit
MTPTPLIDVQNVSYRMGTHTIIDRLSFDIAPQGIVSVIGHNGSGKSTLLQLLLGRLQPSNGRIVKNHNLTM